MVQFHGRAGHHCSDTHRPLQIFRADAGTIKQQYRHNRDNRQDMKVTDTEITGIAGSDTARDPIGLIKRVHKAQSLLCADILNEVK
jgi:hypothetical protein